MATVCTIALFLAASIFPIIKTAAAQDPTLFHATECANEWFGADGTVYNASASYRVPGFYYPGTGTTPPANWTYKTAVDPATYGYQQTVWIETPNSLDIGSRSLPYLGCLSVLKDLPNDTLKRGREDTGDCTKTFDEMCVAALIEGAQRKAPSFADQPLEDDDAFEVCKRMMPTHMPEACRQYTDNASAVAAVSLPAFGDSTFPNGTDSHGCKPSDRRGANRGRFGWISYGTDEQEYEAAVNNVAPVIAMVWGKNATGGWRWTDARLVCMRPSEAYPGGKILGGFPLPSGPSASLGFADDGWWHDADRDSGSCRG
ncbi:MAG: hypothetical protein Q9213_007003, partial [Squamulea squamosa]